MKVFSISCPRQLKQNRCQPSPLKKEKKKVNQNLNHVTEERVQRTTVMQGYRLAQTPC